MPRSCSTASCCRAIMIALVASILSSSALFAQQSYWLGRVDGSDHVFDQQLPKSFGDAIFKADSNRFHVTRNPDYFTPKTVTGTTYSFIKASIGSDYEMFENRKPTRTVSLKSDSGHGQHKDSWIAMKTSEPHVESFAKQLPARQQGKWFYADLMICVSPNESKPGVRVSIFGEGTRYWSARREGNDYVFDTPVPHDFGSAIAAPGTENSYVVEKNPKGYVAPAGTSLVKARLTWDKPQWEKSQVAFTNRNGKGGLKWFASSRGKPAGAKLATQIAEPSGKAWISQDFLILVTPDSKTSNLRLPIQAPDLARLNMIQIGAQTKPGIFYSEVQIPSNPDAFRQEMLTYGNLGRRDPNFRVTHNSKTATDLSGDTIKTQANIAGKLINKWMMETVTKHNATPPYFADHVMHDALNRAAQFQAEYQAKIQSVTHDGPGSYALNGKNENMSKAHLRMVALGGLGGWEACGAGGLDGYPHGWMKSETHFRPWFNVNGDVREVGYGAAQGTNGTWYFTAVGLTLPNKLGAIDAVATTGGTTDSGAGNQPNQPTQQGISLVDKLVGSYENQPPTNDWHYVNIHKDANGNLIWKNRAGVSWSLPFKGKELWAGADCPYGELKMEIQRDKAGEVSGVKVGEGIYKKKP